MAVSTTCNYQSYWYVSGIKILFYLQRNMPKDAEKNCNDTIRIAWFYFLEIQLKVAAIKQKEKRKITYF
jgi:hypothetical protein